MKKIKRKKRGPTKSKQTGGAILFTIVVASLIGLVGIVNIAIINFINIHDDDEIWKYDVLPDPITTEDIELVLEIKQRTRACGIVDIASVYESVKNRRSRVRSSPRSSFFLLKTEVRRATRRRIGLLNIILVVQYAVSNIYMY